MKGKASDVRVCVRVASKNRRLAHMTDSLCNRGLLQVFCTHSAIFKLNVAFFTEKSSIEVPLIYTHSIGKMAASKMLST